LYATIQEQCTDLKVIPVIDILNGIVVHAVRGRRKEYHPLQSTLSKSVEPLEVAKAFRNLGFGELYLADLDAILGYEENFQVLGRIAEETELKLMVDSGVNSINEVEKLLDSGVSKVIIGTETLACKGFVGETVRSFGAERVIVSLDMNDNKLITKAGFDGCQKAMCLLREFEAIGVSQIIVLDLARVGSCEGVNADFLKKAIDALEVDVYVGGGVCEVTDLVELKNLGASGVLLATALHSGKISIADLRQAGLI